MRSVVSPLTGDRATVERMTTLALGDEQGAPDRLMPNIGTTLLDRLLGQTQGLGIATLPSVSSSILVPT